MQTTKAIMADKPVNFENMVLKIYDRQPAVETFRIADTIEMSHDDFIELASDFQKPREWLRGKCGMCDAMGLVSTLRITSGKFPIALIVDTGGRDRARRVGFEITEK
jgi:hypothetical protein